MISAILTLVAVFVLVSNPVPGGADTPAASADDAALSADNQCRSIELTMEQMTLDKPTVEATNRVYCQFRVFCPAGHRCCASGVTFWCCPRPATCDADMDADDWTGCHGAQGVNPL